ncbi:MAG: hypothetical protein NC240_03175 [Clostridium sp.]|nr:hypothetical protein [Clostridium sp.]
MKKKIVSLIMSAALLAGLVPVNIKAQELEKQMQTEATSSDAYELDVIEAEGETLVEDTLEVEANQVQINEDNFPDENFRKYIKENFDKNNDDIVDDVGSITTINVSACGIYSLKGIEFFGALEELFCSGCQLTSLDVSKNTALESLICFGCNLTSLDVSKNTALERLDCYQNRLTSLDVSKNMALEWLDCDGNQLINLDVSKNTSLRRLVCGYNQLTSLDVSKNASLSQLGCNDNQLTSLDVSKNTALGHLNCGGNRLTSLDVSKNTALEWLECYENQLTSLDVSKNMALKDFNCYQNQLTSLNVCKNTSLTKLNCGYNSLTSLDVSKNASLTELNCSHNPLTNLDVSKNASLTELNCSHNPLTNLDVSKNTLLDVLMIDSNITTDISSKKLMMSLYICVPQLKGTIDFSNITGIEKYMSGSGWDVNTKKLTYELEIYDDYSSEWHKIGRTTLYLDTGRFSTYQDCNFYRDVYGDVRCYDSNGDPVIDEFKCDGTYTYYFQADGTAMRNRLTYHPDGKHVIYFDENGHEVFSNFHHVEKSIAGEAVDDFCFFDVYGYLYVDVMTYDQAGEKLYYVNPYGVIEQNKWFEFSDTCVWAGTTNKVGKGYGYANADGTLMVNTYTYDWRGNFVYLQGNGHMK